MAEVLDEIDRPNLTLQELQEWLYYDNDLPVTLRQLKRAVERDELVGSMLSNRLYYSKQEGLDWVAAQRGKKRRMRPYAAQ